MALLGWTFGSDICWKLYANIRVGADDDILLSLGI